MKFVRVPVKGAPCPPMPVEAGKANDALVSWFSMKFGRVGSPEVVLGEKVTRFPGFEESAGFTAMRPARPRICDPVEVIVPVMGVVPSRNNGSCGLPLCRVVTVAAPDSELTTAPLELLLSTVRTVPELENCRLLPRARLSCDTTDAIPVVKLTPITGLFGSALGNGNAAGSSTRTTVAVCCTLPESV